MAFIIWTDVTGVCLDEIPQMDDVWRQDYNPAAWSLILHSKLRLWCLVNLISTTFHPAPLSGACETESTLQCNRNLQSATSDLRPQTSDLRPADL